MEVGHGLSAKSGRAEPSQAKPSRAKSSHLTPWAWSTSWEEWNLYVGES